jgi:hypothetical protein
MALGIGALLSSAWIPSAHAETYYRWQDAKGNPVHSDRPPPAGIDYEVINTGSKLVRKVEAEQGAVPATTRSTPSNEFSTQPSEPETTVEKNPEYCSRAQANLQTLNTNARVRIRDNNGEYVYLSQEEKDIQRKKAQDLIAVHCDN